MSNYAREGERQSENINKTESLLTSSRSYLLILATGVALVISYYFLIALPEHNRALLQLERERFEAAQQREEAAQQKSEEERQTAEEKERERATARSDCEDEAEAAYWSHIKLNGSPVEGKPNTYFAPYGVWDRAAKIKKATLNYCYQKRGLVP